MPRTSIRQLVATERPLVTPLAYDALSARLIERAGFKGVAIGGSGLFASRYGLPDIGLGALGEMLAGVRDIVAATDLPVVVDGDDGYGDNRSVAHMVETYRRLGVSGIVLEDQMLVAKQPGDSGATAVVTPEIMEGKIRTAVAGCAGSDLQIIARCDALRLEGMDAALRRGERYLAAGAHGLFVPGLATHEQLATVGRHFRGAYLMAVVFEGRGSWLPPAELYDLGFHHITLPGLLVPRVVDRIDQTLQAFRRFAETGEPMPAFATEPAQQTLNDALHAGKWQTIPATGAGGN